MSAFKHMEEGLEAKGYSPGSAAAITAAHGIKKYGKNVMEKAAHAGVSAKAMQRRLHAKRMGA